MAVRWMAGVMEMSPGIGIARGRGGLVGGFLEVVEEQGGDLECWAVTQVNGHARVGAPRLIYSATLETRASDPTRLPTHARTPAPAADGIPHSQTPAEAVHFSPTHWPTRSRDRAKATAARNIRACAWAQ